MKLLLKLFLVFAIAFPTSAEHDEVVDLKADTLPFRMFSAKGEDICLAVEDPPKIGSDIIVKTCDYKEHSLEEWWTTHPDLTIRPLSNPSLCIRTIKTDNNKQPLDLTLKKCPSFPPEDPDERFQFLISGVDYTITSVNRPGFVFDSNGGPILRLKKRDFPRNSYQTWMQNFDAYLDYTNNPCDPVNAKGKCGLCHGDCDEDDDCAGDMVCGQSEQPGFEIPGCGTNDIYYYSYNDYCFYPTRNYVWPDNVNYVGECGPDSKFGLCGHCEGDCDEDNDCDGDLVCFQRGKSNFKDPVPGCFNLSDGHKLKDFCVRVEDIPPKPKCFKRASFNAGYGSCETYTPNYVETNYNWCDSDYDSKLGIYAVDACSECGKCQDIFSPTESPTTSPPTESLSMMYSMSMSY